MHRRLFTAILAAVFILPLSAHAEEIGYSYVDVAYVGEALEAGSDGHGFGIGLSVGLHPHIHVCGSYEDLSFDEYQVFPAFDGTTWKLGVGWNGGLGEWGDLIARAGYVNYEIDMADESVSNDGFEVAAGIRAMVTPKLELNGFVNHIELSDEGDDTGIEGGIVYNFTNHFAARGRLEISEGDVSWSAGVRIYWGK